MVDDPQFEGFLVRLIGKDREAAGEVDRRYVHRLIALACRRVETWARAKADRDVEDLVQSAFRSFFARLDYLRAARRDVGREWTERPDGDEGGLDGLASREPTPEEAAILAETVACWLEGLEEPERQIVELGLQGYPTAAIAERLGRSERSVRRVRQRAESSPERLVAPEAAGP